MYSAKEQINAKNTNGNFLSASAKIISRTIFIAVLALFAVIAANAQTANVYGSLGNFDVINHTGDYSHGFEIELEGIQPQNVYYSFSAQRYGAANVLRRRRPERAFDGQVRMSTAHLRRRLWRTRRTHRLPVRVINGAQIITRARANISAFR